MIHSLIVNRLKYLIVDGSYNSFARYSEQEKNYVICKSLIQEKKCLIAKYLWITHTNTKEVYRVLQTYGDYGERY